MNTMQTRTSQPHFYDEESMGAWDRVKEAFRRDWEQTKHDLGLSGGHELNQSALDTIKQATAAESIPADDRPNPPKVIGAWDEAEYPIGYGYAARRKYWTARRGSPTSMPMMEWIAVLSEDLCSVSGS